MNRGGPTPMGRRMLNAFALGYVIGWLWPGGFVGGLFCGLGFAFAYCVGFLVWSLLNW